jgi:serine/threonine protein kinase
MMSNYDGTVKRVSDRSNTGGADQLRFANTNTLLLTAARVVEDAVQESNIFEEEMEARVPKFHPSEITKGHVVGRGGFCVCQEIEKIKPIAATKVRRGMSTKSLDGAKKGFFMFRIMQRGSTTGDDTSSACNLLDENEKMTRDYVVQQAKDTRTNRRCCYVVKSVSKDVPKLTYMKGNVDIALEGKFLSSLSHRNIIDLVAVSSLGPCTESYFLVLERMQETLGSRLKIWMDRERMTQGIMGCVGGAKRAEQLYIERVEVSYDIASAMQYLHSRKIMYRDLKPDNVGFDSNNVVKLFDFGLAKELKEEDKTSKGLYRNMTGMTGAIRYMAPEVGTGNPYNESADVYSWSMLMWFILALEPPFGLYTEDMIMDRCWVKGYRPVIFRRWTPNIQDLIRSTWDANPSKRVSFLQVTLALKQELLDFDQVKTTGSVTTSLDTSL